MIDEQTKLGDLMKLNTIIPHLAQGKTVVYLPNKLSCPHCQNSTVSYILHRYIGGTFVTGALDNSYFTDKKKTWCNKINPI